MECRPLIGNHQWEALVSLLSDHRNVLSIAELVCALVSLGGLVLNSKTNTNARDFSLKKKKNRVHLHCPVNILNVLEGARKPHGVENSNYQLLKGPFPPPPEGKEFQLRDVTALADASEGRSYSNVHMFCFCDFLSCVPQAWEVNEPRRHAASCV